MSLKRNDIRLDCEQCIYMGGGPSSNEITVAVPVEDLRTGQRMKASLTCTITEDSHQLKLNQLEAEDDVELQFLESEDRLNQFVDYLSDKRICGSRDLCPAEVVAQVQAASDQCIKK